MSYDFCFLHVMAILKQVMCIVRLLLDDHGYVGHMFCTICFAEATHNFVAKFPPWKETVVLLEKEIIYS